jgi:hypothetical protein
MAGFEIVDTYKAYKVREKKVTSWLKETAARFGFRSRGDALGASNGKSEDVIKISEIPAAVRVIVSNGEYVSFKRPCANVQMVERLSASDFRSADFRSDRFQRTCGNF